MCTSEATRLLAPSHFINTTSIRGRYADDEGNATEIYPFNPNGSPDGVAALCSEDGRHLAMMPHPERSFRKWQAPWAPAGWVQHEAAPWLRLFQNATQFCGTAPRGCYTS